MADEAVLRNAFDFGRCQSSFFYKTAFWEMVLFTPLGVPEINLDYSKPMLCQATLYGDFDNELQHSYICSVS
jgi:hypothetical protein